MDKDAPQFEYFEIPDKYIGAYASKHGFTHFESRTVVDIICDICYEISVSEITTDVFICSKHKPILSSFMTYQWTCKKCNSTGETSGAEPAYPPEVPEFTPVF